MKSNRDPRRSIVQAQAPAKSRDLTASGEQPGAVGNQAMQAILSGMPQRSTTRSGNIPRSPGIPLDASTRRDMETRIGHDFGAVRVHTGADAAASADALGATAYAAGDEIVFEAGAYAPQTPVGRKLLAHELTHVVQQRGATAGTGTLRVETDRAAEQEADHVADGLDRGPANAPPEIRHRTDRAYIARQPKASEFPGFSQKNFITCGAASIVSAIMIWDRERNGGGQNQLLIAACNAVLVYLDDNRSAVIARLNSVPRKDETGKGKEWYADVKSGIEMVRTNALTAGQALTEGDYQLLSLALYLLYKDDKPGGLKSDKIRSIQSTVGVAAVKSAVADSFDTIMDKLVDLAPGQIAQVVWYSRGNVRPDGSATMTNHVFLVGRFLRGAWFVSDQGEIPPLEIEAPDLPTLISAIRANTLAKNGGIHTGGMPTVATGDGQQATLLNQDKGVMILGDRKGIETKARNVVMVPGDFIAEVDASAFSSGNRIVAWDFVDRTYNLADAKTALTGAGTGSGGVILENPVGLFHVFKTNLVSDGNVMETAIDESDSAGGRVAKPKRYYHAWLQLRSSKRLGSFFQVY